MLFQVTEACAGKDMECTDVGPSQGATEHIWLCVGELVCVRSAGGCAE